MKNYFIDIIFVVLGTFIWVISIITELYNSNVAIIITAMIFLLGHFFGKVKRKMKLKEKILFYIFILYIMMKNLIIILQN